MSKKSEDRMDTHDSVLLAGIEVFSKCGYHEAKVSDICSMANANVSAVNYYFHSKDSLYLEVWKMLGTEYVEWVTTLVNNPSMDSESKLRLLLERNIRDGLSETEGSRLARLAFFEQSSPSPVFGEICENFFFPLHKKVITLMRNYLGAGCDDYTMKIAGSCIRGPIYGLMALRMRELNGTKDKTEKAILSDLSEMFDDTDRLAEYVIEYTIAGLQRLKK